MTRNQRMAKDKNTLNFVSSISTNKPKTLEESFSVIDSLVSLLLTYVDKSLLTDSINSHIPPSSDQNRERKPSVNKGRKPGAQKGHQANILEPVKNPDKIVNIRIPDDKIPSGYTRAGYIRRQVFDFECKRIVTEYRADVYRNSKGHEIHGEFPPHVTSNVQYGETTRSHVVYLSVYQLMPSLRITEYFADRLLPISEGFVFDCLTRANNMLVAINYESWLRATALEQTLLHADETGMNIAGRKAWLHTLSNDRFTYYHVNQKRGKDACNEMAVLPSYSGILVHDCWSPYFSFQKCAHVLCNAHITRELRGISEKYERRWADNMLRFFEDAYGIYKERSFTDEEKRNFRRRYRQILTRGEKEEEKVKVGGMKAKKARNLLARLRKYEAEATRFIFDPSCPYTNNQAENDLRMTKVKMKVSGCFRSLEWARKFYLIRSYISTCKKNNVSASEALNYLFNGEIPPFMRSGE